MPYDFAPRLAARAAARRRQRILFTLCVLALPALSFQLAPQPVAVSGVSVLAQR